MSSTRNTSNSPSGFNRYPEELKRQAADLFNSSLPEHETRQAAAKHVAGLSGADCFDTVLTRASQSEINRGMRSGITTEAAEEPGRLRRFAAELKRADAILGAASVCFAAEVDRPPNKSFMDKFLSHREAGGLMRRIEPVCAVLEKNYGISVSRSCYYAFKRRGKSAREEGEEDDRLSAKIEVIYTANYGCYGIREIWRALPNEGEKVARRATERLMKRLSLRGAVRGKIKRATIARKDADFAEDPVKRQFDAPKPDELRVADSSYATAGSGWCHTALITDVFAGTTVGYNVSARMDRNMVKSAFTMALHASIIAV
ncbi:MAG: IS3 family transposase [Synergistaceae bacterium]|jgi:hypothetical protein|nr:IS3 family transposase [Synergistaceae bacterium]